MNLKGNGYCNFRPITRAADNQHPTTKQNRRLTQSSSIVFVDMRSFSVQWINFHISCFRCFIVNDTTCKNLFSKKKNRYFEIYWVEEIAWNGKYSVTQDSASYEYFTDASNKELLHHSLSGAMKETCRHHFPYELLKSLLFHNSII